MREEPNAAYVGDLIRCTLSAYHDCIGIITQILTKAGRPELIDYKVFWFGGHRHKALGKYQSSSYFVVINKAGEK